MDNFMFLSMVYGVWLCLTTRMHDLHNTLIANISFENVAIFKYMGTTAKNNNYIRKEIKSRLNSGYAY
jgi:hypothetical protein